MPKKLKRVHIYDTVTFQNVVNLSVNHLHPPPHRHNLPLYLQKNNFIYKHRYIILLFRHDSRRDIHRLQFLKQQLA